MCIPRSLLILRSTLITVLRKSYVIDYLAVLSITPTGARVVVAAWLVVLGAFDVLAIVFDVPVGAHFRRVPVRRVVVMAWIGQLDWSLKMS
jgi:hypothetical protein